MSALTDVEISRALNAVSATLRDQNHEAFDPARVESIARGALAGEPKITAAQTGAASGVLRRRADGCVLAEVERVDGQWRVQRKVRAGGSDWARPQPARRRGDASAPSR